MPSFHRRIGTRKTTSRNSVGYREGLFQRWHVSQVVVPVQTCTDHHVHACLCVWPIPGGLLDSALDGVDRSVAQGADHSFTVETSGLGPVDELEGQLRQGTGQG